MTRCAKGTRRNKKTGKCEPHATSSKKNSKGKTTKNNASSTKKSRCVKGTRRNKKTGKCDHHTTSSKKNSKGKSNPPTLKEWDNELLVDDNNYLYDVKDRKKIGKVVDVDNAVIEFKNYASSTKKSSKKNNKGKSNKINTLKEWDSELLVDDDNYLYDVKNRKKVGKVLDADNAVLKFF